MGLHHGEAFLHLDGETGEVYVLYGPVLGHADVDEADATLIGLGADSYTGTDIAPMGDSNRDGYPDFLVGAPGTFPSGSDDDGETGAVTLRCAVGLASEPSCLRSHSRRRP